MSLAVMSPGQDFVIVTNNSLCYNRKIGVFTSLGISAGAMTLVILSMAGVGLLLKNQPKIFEFIKVCGGFYLMYIGAKISIFTNRYFIFNSPTEKIKKITHLKAFSYGYFCSILNPKAVLFFTAIFSFIIETKINITIQMMYGAEIVILYLAWFTFIPYMVTQPIVMSIFCRYQYLVNLLLGAIVFSLGVGLLFHSI